VRVSDLKSLSHWIGQQIATQAYDVVDGQPALEKVQPLDGTGAQARDT
jgi:hypothetical protein